jgi:FkbM family methyltransferase
MVFLVDAGDRLIGPRFIVDGEYEPETTSFMLKTIKPDNVCIDVGANFGYYTCLMARLSWRGRTISFEPDPHVFELLRDNVHINWCEAVVEPVNAAVGNSAGNLTLYRRISRSGNTSIIRMEADELDLLGEKATEEFTIDCVCLDDYADQLDRVDIVKVDVEGAESLVLAGMQELVRRHRPTVVMEWSPAQAVRAGFSVADLTDQVRSLCLLPHTLGANGALSPVSYQDLASLTYRNLVLTPS